ncbi:MAG TPA: carboxypeptidase regulatory-like domain-containing protein, partial [Pseudonocardia sp.]|nr:carboxypeptidase regulatory-like domain-containing protein [Pseudonocardia sp.]
MAGLDAAAARTSDESDVPVQDAPEPDEVEAAGVRPTSGPAEVVAPTPEAVPPGQPEPHAGRDVVRADPDPAPEPTGTEVQAGPETPGGPEIGADTPSAASALSPASAPSTVDATTAARCDGAERHRNGSAAAVEPARRTGDHESGSSGVPEQVRPSLRLVPASAEAPEAAAAKAVAIPSQRAPLSESSDPLLLGAIAGLRAFGPISTDDHVVTLSGVESVAAPSDGEGSAQRIDVRITRRDGSVIGGAGARLLDGRGEQVAAGYADAQGCGRLLAPHATRYLLVCTAPEHQPGAVAVSTVDGPVQAHVALIRSASVRGTVGGPGGPVAGARLTLQSDGEPVDAVDSESDGGYQLVDVAAGGYGLTAVAGGCAPSTAALDIADGAQLHVDFALEPALSRRSAGYRPAVQRVMIGNG